MRLSQDDAVRIVDDFFKVKGHFAERPPAGIAGSAYPKELARIIEGLDSESQTLIGGVLLGYDMNGTHALSRAAAYVAHRAWSAST
jgi:hypothetical protein